MMLIPYPALSVLYIVTFLLLMVPGRAFAAANAATTNKVPDNVQQYFDSLEQHIQTLQQRQVLLAANNTMAPASQPSTEQCPRKTQTYSSELEALQNTEKEKRDELKQLNDQLNTIKLGMYTRLAEQKMMCLETTAAELLPIKTAADQLYTSAHLRKVDHLLVCIDNSMTKIENRISAARTSNNTMKVMRLDSIRSQLANFRSIATTLSQQFAVHENKRARLANDADESTNNCEESEDL